LLKQNKKLLNKQGNEHIIRESTSIGLPESISIDNVCDTNKDNNKEDVRESINATDTVKTDLSENVLNNKEELLIVAKEQEERTYSELEMVANILPIEAKEIIQAKIRIPEIAIEKSIFLPKKAIIKNISHEQNKEKLRIFFKNLCEKQGVGKITYTPIEYSLT
jgi:hypothetical protein